MAGSIDFFPGFPLPVSDYVPLLRELGDLAAPFRVAHSQGSLRALAEEGDLPTALLAPSTPGRHARRLLLRTVVRVAARTPGGDALAVRLRQATYRRYGAVPLPGEPLSLADAAERLLPMPEAPLPALSRVIVVCSRQDPRHAAQVDLARELGAPVHWLEGGHLFPIVQPGPTARLILAALG